MKAAYKLKVGKIVASYVGLALLWIFGSDYLADTVLHKPSLHTSKGAAFVLVTGALLAIVLRRAAASIRTFEQDLLASREQFRRVIENAPEAILIQVGGVFTYANPAALALLGASAPDELLGRPILERVHPAYHQQVRDRIQILRERGEPVPPIEQRFLRMDGTSVEAEVSAAPFDVEAKNGALVFIRDISQRKRIERQRQHLEEQVRQAQKMESIGRLAGGVAHDFNNLLTVINGYADMLLATMPESGDEWSFVREIRDAGNRAAGLTTQLLTFSRRQPLSPRIVDLNVMVREVERMLRRIVGEDISIRTDLVPAVGPIFADPTCINQLIMNLVVNARDAMPGGGDVIIRTSRSALAEPDCLATPQARPGDFVRLTIADSGEGIPPEIQSRIFEPFFTTKGEGKGTGLGLSTVYGIVRDCDGWIEVDSAPGRGTAMHVWIPVHVPTESTGSAEPPPKESRGSELVLLVEDDRAVRLAVETMLRGFGYSVLTAQTGEQAIALARRHRGHVEIVLSDVMMPGMPGTQLVRRLREEQPSLKVLLMSGYRPEELPAAPSREPELPCISKPFAPEALARMVREILDGDPVAL